MLIVLKKSVAQKKKKRRKKAESENLELLVSGCPWRQNSRSELSRVRSVAPECPASMRTSVYTACKKVHLHGTVNLPSFKVFLCRYFSGTSKLKCFWNLCNLWCCKLGYRQYCKTDLQFMSTKSMKLRRFYRKTFKVSTSIWFFWKSYTSGSQPFYDLVPLGQWHPELSTRTTSCSASNWLVVLRGNINSTNSK